MLVWHVVPIVASVFAYIILSKYELYCGAGTGFNADAVRYFSRPEVSDIARNIRHCDVLAQGGITFRQQNAMCGIWLKCGLLPQYSLSSTKMNNYSGGVSFTWFFREP